MLGLTGHGQNRLLLQPPTRTVRGGTPLCSAGAGPSPDEWRAFRARLISGGVAVTGEVPVAVERLAVAPANEELLREQSTALWREYSTGAWAHVAPQPEAGGLLCRVPIQAQCRSWMREPAERRPVWGERLATKLRESLPDPEPDEADAAAEAGSQAQTEVLAGVAAEEPAEELAEARRRRLEASWSSNTAYMYRLADGLIRGCMESIGEKAEAGKRIRWERLSDEEQVLVKAYADAQGSWQEVALVLATEEAGSAGSVATEAVVLNRPLARACDESVARLLLNGGDMNADAGYDDALVARFVRAFGAEAAVYVGGPDEQDAPGIVVHGRDLPGAAEIAPGTGIYTGGVEAIVDGVLGGEFQPLDFRWFLGRRQVRRHLPNGASRAGSLAGGRCAEWRTTQLLASTCRRRATTC